MTRGQSWLCQANCKLDCVCSSDLFTSPAECHVVAGHPAGCNDRLHSNLPDTQQDKTSSQLPYCVWSCISILLLFSLTSCLSVHITTKYSNSYFCHLMMRTAEFLLFIVINKPVCIINALTASTVKFTFCTLNVKGNLLLYIILLWSIMEHYFECMLTVLSPLL